MLTNHKELREIIREAERAGWAFDKHRGHIKGRHPDGRTTTVAVSPSDYRAVRNIRKYLGLGRKP